MLILSGHTFGCQNKFPPNETGGMRTFAVTASTITFPYLANIFMKYFPMSKYFLSLALACDNVVSVPGDF